MQHEGVAFVSRSSRQINHQQQLSVHLLQRDLSARPFTGPTCARGIAAIFSTMISDGRSRPVADEAAISTQQTPPRVEEPVIRQTSTLSRASASISPL